MNLVEIFDKSRYMIPIGNHKLEDIREILEQLEETNLNLVYYWENKSKVMDMIAENSMYQFGLGNYDQGLSISGLYNNLNIEFKKREETNPKKQSFVIDFSA